MLDSVQHLIQQYGYGLMLIGALIEGETFLIAGGIAAHQGLLHLPGLIALAFIGSIIHDYTCFFIGRYAGTWLLKRFPKIAAKIQFVFRLSEKYGVGLIIISRYAYGFRIIIPVILGMSRIKTYRFLIFNAIGGILWSMTFILGGYYIGKALMQFIDSSWLSNPLSWLIILIVIIIVIAIISWSITRFLLRKDSNN